MADKQPDLSELNHLAIEACDMWQEHLSTLATNPDARSELTRFLEPQRRLFADWASMMQQGLGGGKNDGRTQNQSTTARSNDTAKSSSTETAAAPSAAEASCGAAHGDDPLRVAQLALRVAELEKRLAKLESKSGASGKAQRTTP